MKRRGEDERARKGGGQQGAGGGGGEQWSIFCYCGLACIAFETGMVGLHALSSAPEYQYLLLCAGQVDVPIDRNRTALPSSCLVWTQDVILSTTLSYDRNVTAQALGKSPMHIHDFDASDFSAISFSYRVL